MWENVVKCGSVPSLVKNDHNWDINNQLVYWSGSDTPANFKKQTNDHIEFWSRPENKIEYYYNKWGFRTEEFEAFVDCDPDELIVFLGCSFTLGTGLPVEYTFPHIIGKELGRKVINLGIGGSGLDAAFRVYNAWQYIFRAELTIAQSPPGARIQKLWFSYTGDKKTAFEKSFFKALTGSTSYESEEANLLKLEFLDDRNYLCHQNMVRTAIQMIAHNTESRLFFTDAHLPKNEGFSVSDTVEEKKYKIRAARDNMHYGKYWHEQKAEEILTEIAKGGGRY